MAGAKFVKNEAGIVAILKSAAVRAELHAAAERVLAAAQAAAPFESGEYRSSLHIEDETTDRAVVKVGSSLPYALRVEANHGTLTRAMDA